MKRVALALTATLAVLFILITVVKGRRSGTQDPAEIDALAQDQRDSIQRFWQHYRAATQYRVSGEWREAAAEYTLALELNGEHRDALYYLGNVKFESGEFAAAEQAWKRLASVDPTGSRGFQRLGDLYFCFEQHEFFDPAQARTAFLRALAINSEETGPLIRLGQIALVQDQPDTALYYLDAVTVTNHRSVPAYFFKGYVAWTRGQSQLAFEMFRNAAQHYQPLQPSGGASSEGDTETGKAILAETGQCQAFEAHAEDLPDPDDPDLRRLMQERYSELDRFLEAASRKTRN